MTAPATPAKPQEPIVCQPDSGFLAWLAGSGGSLAISTYQAGKLLLVGWNGQQISFLPRHFDKPMGLDIADDRMALATRHAIWTFGNARPLAHHYRKPGEYDALFLPRTMHPMPDLNIHDLAYAGDELWTVNTRMSCLATLSPVYTFQPRWRPRFVTELVPEDRCHLNGLAVADGKPAWVTALGESDSAAGWREKKASGGIVVNVATNEVVLRGLAMPHSPRWRDGAVWLLNSGAGQLLRLDPASGKAEVVIELPGYLRGLTFVGDYALIGSCTIRETNIFGGMPVQQRHAQLTCGVFVLDLRSGRVAGLLRFTSGCTEVYDLRFLPGARRPNVLNLEKADIKDAVYAPDCHYWLRPEYEVKDGRA